MEIGLCMSDKLFTFCLSTRKAAQYYTRYHLMGSTLKWAVEKESHLVFLWWYKTGNRQVAKLLLGIFLLFSMFPDTCVACRCSHFGLGSYVWILNIVWHNPYLPRTPFSSIIIFTKVIIIITSIMMLLTLTRLWVVKDDEPHRATAAGFRTVCVNTGD